MNHCCDFHLLCAYIYGNRHKWMFQYALALELASQVFECDFAKHFLSSNHCRLFDSSSFFVSFQSTTSAACTFSEKPSLFRCLAAIALGCSCYKSLSSAASVLVAVAGSPLHVNNYVYSLIIK